MGDVYNKSAIKAKNGKIYAPGKSDTGYILYVLCENYSGRARGGIAKTWRAAKTGLTLDELKTEINRIAGRNIY